jgi:hypothetical protein
MKYIIAGGRDFTDFQVMKAVCSQFTDITEVVSGCAHGADILGENYAHMNHIHVKYFPADWDYYGHAAGFIRNIEMAQYADCVICFWDGKSKGTEHMIKTARRNGLPYWVFNYKGEKIEEGWTEKKE